MIPNIECKSSCFFLKIKFPSVVLIILLFHPFISNAQDGEQLFKTHCTACHTIGKGKLVGPDLAGISSKISIDWKISFIRSSRQMIESGDADAVAIAQKYSNILMPDYMGTDEEIKAIIKYIDHIGESPIAETQSSGETKRIYPGNIDTGRMYFEGILKFQNRGASCVSCHHVNFNGSIQGGLLAKDLTKSFTTSGGEAGLNAIISNPPFPSMKEAFKKDVITPREIAHLTAYLKASSETKTELKPTLISDTIIIALFLVAFLFFIIGLFYFKRKKESVNKAIMDRQSRF